MHASDYWPPPSVHRDHWEHHHNPYVYEYDPTDDGPEAHIVRSVLASHTQGELWEEWLARGVRILNQLILDCERELRHRKNLREGRA
jgi:hypothetical protein